MNSAPTLSSQENTTNPDNDASIAGSIQTITGSLLEKTLNQLAIPPMAMEFFMRTKKLRELFEIYTTTPEDTQNNEEIIGIFLWIQSNYNTITNIVPGTDITHDFGLSSVFLGNTEYAIWTHPKRNNISRKYAICTAERTAVSILYRTLENQGKVGFEKVSKEDFEDIINTWFHYRREVEVSYKGNLHSGFVLIPLDVILTFISNAANNSLGAKANKIHIDISYTHDALDVSIQDDGPGMDDPMNIFTPGFTTQKNPEKHGTGLKRLPRVSSIYTGIHYEATGHGGLENQNGGKGMKLSIKIPYLTQIDDTYIPLYPNALINTELI